MRLFVFKHLFKYIYLLTKQLQIQFPVLANLSYRKNALIFKNLFPSPPYATSLLHAEDEFK